MRLFEDFFARPHRKRGQPHFPPNLEGKGCWWDDPSALPLAAARGFNVELVGELQWQAEIAAAVGGRCEEGHNCQVPAVLVLADDPRDPNAVGVTINSRPVGWIAAAAAAEIRPQLVALNAESRPVTCRAKIVGGWNRGRSDRGYFGVKLSIALPLKVHRKASCRASPAVFSQAKA